MLKSILVLPKRAQTQSTLSSAPTAFTSETMGDLKEIMEWVTSGTLSKYIKKFKIMTDVMRQPDKPSKLLALGLHIMDMLNGEEE